MMTPDQMYQECDTLQHKHLHLIHLGTCEMGNDYLIMIRISLANKLCYLLEPFHHNNSIGFLFLTALLFRKQSDSYRYCYKQNVPFNPTLPEEEACMHCFVSLCVYFNDK